LLKKMMGGSRRV